MGGDRDRSGRARPLDRRAMRKRGVLREIGAALSEASARADPDTATRMRRVNAFAASSFILGGSLFALGAALAQAGVATVTYCSVYLVGGFFFSSGGYASLLQAINGPRQVGAAGLLSAPAWRWWSREPERLEWLSAAVLLAGTIVFAINIVDSFIGGLGASAENRLVWSPDMVGCSLFLISGHLAMVEMGGWGRRPRDLGWWIVLVNQIGSVLFMLAAVASFVRPASGDEVALGIANWGTLSGALCFAIAGAMQERERPLT
jgi:hypothetical protein